MIYRDTGQFKHSYEKDQELFPISQDRWGIGVILLIAFVLIPLIANDYWLQAILIPFSTEGTKTLSTFWPTKD